MKIGFSGLEFPEGKVKYNDSRLLKIAKKFGSKKISPFFFEFLRDEFSRCSAMAVKKDKIDDIIIRDMEKIESILGKNIPEQTKKLLEKCMNLLEDEKLIFDSHLEKDEEKIIREFSFITAKPVIVLDGEIPTNEIIKQVLKKAEMIFFYTAGKKETKSWLVKNNSNIVTCAEKIHSDFARGFIRADVVNYDDFAKLHNWHEAKEKGFLKTVGKDYIVRDGDIIEIKFNV